MDQSDPKSGTGSWIRDTKTRLPRLFDVIHGDYLSLPRLPELDSVPSLASPESTEPASMGSADSAMLYSHWVDLQHSTAFEEFDPIVTKVDYQDPQAQLMEDVSPLNSGVSKDNTLLRGHVVPKKNLALNDNVAPKFVQPLESFRSRIQHLFIELNYTLKEVLGFLREDPQFPE